MRNECIIETYNAYFPELVKSMRKYAYIIQQYNWRILWTDPEFMEEQRKIIGDIFYKCASNSIGFCYPKAKLDADVSWLLSRRVVLIVYQKAYKLIRSGVQFNDAKCMIKF